MADNQEKDSYCQRACLSVDPSPYLLLSEITLRPSWSPTGLHSSSDPFLSQPHSSTSTHFDPNAPVCSSVAYSKPDEEVMEQVDLSSSPPHPRHPSNASSSMIPNLYHTSTPAPTYRSELSSPNPSLVFKDSSKSESTQDGESTPSQTHRRPKIHHRVKKSVKREGRDFKEAISEIGRFIKHNDWKATFKNMFKRKYWGWWFLVVVIITLSSLLSSYHTKIAMALKPYQQQIKATSWAWIIPTALLIVVSFPPLFGHELIILVVGMIWGTWIGFAIASGGTFLGEIATYFAFKYMISRKSQKIEEKSVTYASLAKLMREGGLLMVILVRASAIPGHVCTAMQATIGVGFWTFTIACFVTLPKQFALVYVGVLLGDTNPAADDPLIDESISADQAEADVKFHHAISAIVFIITAFFTIISAYIVWMRMRRIRPSVQQEFRKRELAIDEPDAVQLSEKDVRRSSNQVSSNSDYQHHHVFPHPVVT